MMPVIDILDKHNKKDMFIVIKNCRIHHSSSVADSINERGYKPLYATIFDFLKGKKISQENGLNMYTSLVK